MPFAIIIIVLIIEAILAWFLLNNGRKLHKRKLEYEKQDREFSQRQKEFTEKCNELAEIEEQFKNKENEIAALKEEENSLKNSLLSISTEKDNLSILVTKLNTQEAGLQAQINTHTQELERIKNYQNDLERNVQRSFENYCDSLEYNYYSKESEFDNRVNKLRINYDNINSDITQKINQEQQELEKIRQTREAANKALLREQEIKDKLSFYCLQVSEADLLDIKLLENIKPQLTKPRILSMLIWSTYFQKPMTNLCNNILGPNTVCGIYKITNQTNNMCYIGQSNDVSKRLKDHAKCGLGIDTPAGNKLYAAMQKDGLQNFSFELLEQCTREELNEKEKYYIELYQSKEYGYNSNIGINKKD